MAERRMFAKTIIDSDAFLDMPLSTQALYFHLSMRADDDGFINNFKKIQRMIGASEDDTKLLIMKNFLIPFESGVVVIKHWRIHNYIRGDRKKETVYHEEMSLLEVKDNGAYTLNTQVPVIECNENLVNSTVKELCQSNDGQMTVKCQHRIGKDSIGKDSINNIPATETASGQVLDDNEIIIDPNSTKKKEVTINYELEFETLWSMYPNKKSKKDALRYYIRARKKGTTYEEVEQGLKAYLNYIKVDKTEQRYIKHGSTWFNQECWNDDYTIEEKQPKKSFTNRPVREEIVPDWINKKVESKPATPEQIAKMKALLGQK